MIKINIEEIVSYRQKKKSHSDYSLGGWYMIVDDSNGKKYIGKSIEYMFRLRQHLFIKNPKTLVDGIIKDKGMYNFSFYLIKEYNSLKINFFNRKLESKIENKLIINHKSFLPYGYNVRYYE